ncbi:hypothetical protein RvY_00763-2 [Ramazzottius varieornatus]|uniref:tRNA-intron lyase n=1 Tax=Ramazzottius varieornatus TaxID=947166 RepID=A0A1D1UL38_RAMVA|nr:hypothetical protein RvY_00763-2 [Ramazzottius varieornatus]
MFQFEARERRYFAHSGNKKAMEGRRAFGASRTPAFHNQLDNNAVTIPRIPLIPVKHRKPITKRSARGRFGRGDFRNKRRPPRNHESRPYPSTHDDLHLRGLLDGKQVFLYDRADYRFLRLHRGCFGEFIKQSSRGPDTRSTSGGGDGDEEDVGVFPPPLDAQPVAALNLYEAYFLAVECDSLVIWDGSTETAVLIDQHNLMALFVDIDPTFPQFFAVYYHFRMLKYVVTSGVKFGVDMALYQYGPSKTHSIYLVYVIIPGVRDQA